MNGYLRPIDNRFQINGVSMPRPHSFSTKQKWLNKDAERNINTGKLILNPICRIYETTWKYKVLRDDQFAIIFNQVFQSSKSNYEKSFKTIDSRNFQSLSYTTYEQDDFVPPEVTPVQQDGHRYYLDITFMFTNVGGDI